MREHAADLGGGRFGRARQLLLPLTQGEDMTEAELFTGSSRAFRLVRLGGCLDGFRNTLARVRCWYPSDERGPHFTRFIAAVRTAYPNRSLIEACTYNGIPRGESYREKLTVRCRDAKRVLRAKRLTFP
jgi:hypothetical protein